MGSSLKMTALAFLAFLAVTPLFADDPDTLFYKGNEAYAAEDFEQSIEHYEAVYSQGFESKELHFNLGNAYYKMRNYPKAILNYERALRLDPLNENVRFNLEKSRVYIIDQVDVIPEFILKRLVRGIVELFSSNIWAMISLVSFALGLFLLLLYFLSLKIMLKRLGFFAGIIALAIAVATFFIADSAKKIMMESGGAIVMTPTVTVKGSPNETSTDLFIIHEGLKVYLLDQLNDWYEIKLSDGKQGWVRKSDIETI